MSVAETIRFRWDAADQPILTHTFPHDTSVDAWELEVIDGEGVPVFLGVSRDGCVEHRLRRLSEGELSRKVCVRVWVDRRYEIKGDELLFNVIRGLRVRVDPKPETVVLAWEVTEELRELIGAIPPTIPLSVQVDQVPTYRAEVALSERRRALGRFAAGSKRFSMRFDSTSGPGYSLGPTELSWEAPTPPTSLPPGSGLERASSGDAFKVTLTSPPADDESWQLEAGDGRSWSSLPLARDGSAMVERPQWARMFRLKYRRGDFPAVSAVYTVREFPPIDTVEVGRGRLLLRLCPEPVSTAFVCSVEGNRQFELNSSKPCELIDIPAGYQGRSASLVPDRGQYQVQFAAPRDRNPLVVTEVVLTEQGRYEISISPLPAHNEEIFGIGVAIDPQGDGVTIHWFRPGDRIVVDGGSRAPSGIPEVRAAQQWHPQGGGLAVATAAPPDERVSVGLWIERRGIGIEESGIRECKVRSPRRLAARETPSGGKYKPDKIIDNNEFKPMPRHLGDRDAGGPVGGDGPLHPESGGDEEAATGGVLSTFLGVLLEVLDSKYTLFVVILLIVIEAIVFAAKIFW